MIYGKPNRELLAQPTEQNSQGHSPWKAGCSASNYTLNKGIIPIEILSSPHVFIANNESILNYELW